MDKCLADGRCVSFTFDRETRHHINCWLKDAAQNFNDHSGFASGVRCNVENTPQVAESGLYPANIDDGKSKSDTIIQWSKNTERNF